jgi:hypothetical protein
MMDVPRWPPQPERPEVKLSPPHLELSSPGAVSEREGSFAGAVVCNLPVKYTSLNQRTCRAVWQVYGEGERFRLAQETQCRSWF